MPFVSAPASVDSADDVLAVAQDLIDQGQRALFARPEGAEISCRAGCTACCNQAVPVGPTELRALHRAIAELEPAARDRIRARVDATADRLVNLGFRSDDFARRGDVTSAYFDSGTPCPLLDGDTCAVRSARPLACREYLVVSDPIHCETTPSSTTSPGSGQVVRIRDRADVLTGHARIEHEAGARGPLILAIALAEEPPPALELRPRSGRDVIDELCMAR